MSKVLIVAKNVSQGNILADSIKGPATEVAFVHSVEEADAIFRRETFGLVILDISLETDASAAVQNVKKSSEAASTKRIPLVVVTKSFSDSSFLLDTGEVDVLLEYPAHLEQLRQVVEQFVGC